MKNKHLTAVFIKSTVVVLFLFLCPSSSPGKYQTVEGELYFQAVDFFRIFNAPDSVLNRIEEYTLGVNPDTLDNQQRASYDLIKYAVDHNLLRKPYIRIKTGRNEQALLFMSREAFRRFEDLNCADLRRQQQKMRITARVEDVSYMNIRAYNTVELLQIEKTDGETACVK